MEYQYYTVINTFHVLVVVSCIRGGTVRVPEMCRCWNTGGENVVDVAVTLFSLLCPFFLIPPLSLFLFNFLSTLFVLHFPLHRHASPCPSQQWSLPGWPPSGWGPGWSRRTVQKEPNALVHSSWLPKVQPSIKHKHWHRQPGTKGKIYTVSGQWRTDNLQCMLTSTFEYHLMKYFKIQPTIIYHLCHKNMWI